MRSEIYSMAISMYNYFNRILKPGQHTPAGDIELFGYDDIDADDADRMLTEFTETAIDFTETEEEDGSEYTHVDANSPPVVRLLDLIIAEMRSLGSEKVLINPIGEAASVDFEVNGAMTERDRLPMRLFLALAERIGTATEAISGLEGLDVCVSESDFGKRIEISRASER